MDRRIQQTDRREEVKDQAYHLFPERWAQLYQDEMRAALGLEGAEAEREEPVTDIAALDKWYETAVHNQGKRVVNGSSIPPGMGEYWSDWS